MHLLVAFSDHGFGHIAQAAPVVNALAARRVARHPRGAGDFQLTVLSRAPKDFLAARLRVPFTHHRRNTGVGLVMDDALRVNSAASLAAYHDFHGPRPADWAVRVAVEADFYARLPGGRPDLVLSDVPYLPLAAASRLGVPGVALCSFDWELMFRHYCGDLPAQADRELATRLAGEIRAAYHTVRLFLRPAPSVPGPPWLEARGVQPGRLVPIGPTAEAGRPRRDELDARFPDLTGKRLLLVALGGIATPVDLSSWPDLPGVRIIVRTDEEARRHPSAYAQEDLCEHVPFDDLLASVDAVLTKPGYGTYVEAAVLGLPVLTIPRGDWPEEPHLAAFLAAHTRALEVPATLLAGHGLADALEALWAQPERSPAVPTGNAQAADLLLELVG